MRWTTEERLRRALPYGKWKWRRPEGELIETIFNIRYGAIVTKVGGNRVDVVEHPPEHMKPAEYFYGYGNNSPRNGVLWRNAAARRNCHAILTDWGIDPTEHKSAVGVALIAERRRDRQARRSR
jgi:hypothetical protein